jgi:riboflavin synthase
VFTGLIEETGRVLEVARKSGSWRIAIEGPGIARRLKTGDSVSISGVCLTALSITKKSFEADLAEETVAITSLSRLTAGAVVNLELPMKAGSPLGGHIVQGHVDGVAELISLKQAAQGQDWRLRLRLPGNLARYVVNKGSITVEGISLTVASTDGETVDIAIIPHTYHATNLHALKAGGLLNIEVDVLAKYAEKRRASDEQSGITVERLISEGF